MRRLIAIVSLAMSLTAVGASTGSVKIVSPADGAKLDGFEQHRIDYEVVPGPGADHVHLYIDGAEVAILRRLKGQHTLDTLSPGAHTICIKVVNKAHVPTGVERCINVTVQ